MKSLQPSSERPAGLYEMVSSPSVLSVSCLPNASWTVACFLNRAVRAQTALEVEWMLYNKQGWQSQSSIASVIMGFAVLVVRVLQTRSLIIGDHLHSWQLLICSEPIKQAFVTDHRWFSNWTLELAPGQLGRCAGSLVLYINCVIHSRNSEFV
jgi:hypothetical protein